MSLASRIRPSLFLALHSSSLFFFFNYFLVCHWCSMLRGCLRTDCSLLAARGREEEEAAMPTRSPTSPPGGAQGAHDLPQPPNVLHRTLKSSRHVSLLNISFFNEGTRQKLLSGFFPLSFPFLGLLENKISGKA